MRHEGDEVHIDETEASGGSKPGVMRWVLGISLFIAIALMSAIWIFGAWSQDDDESQISVSRDIQQQEAGGDTDGVLIDDADDAASAGSDTEMQDGLETIEN